MKNINEVLNFTIKFLHHVKFQHNLNTTLSSTLWLKLIFKCTKWWCMMGIVVHSHSTAGTCSPWWHPGNPGTPSPWRPCRGWWWGWRRRATGRRATGWRSCPETPTTTRQHPTVHTRPAETHTGNSKHFLLICWLLFCWFHKCQHLKLCELCVCGTLPRRAGWRGRACTWRSRCNHEPWLNRRVLQEMN